MSHLREPLVQRVPCVTDTVTHDSPHSTRTYTRRHYLSSARTTPNYSSPHSDILYLQKAWLKCGLSTHALRGT